MGSKQKRSQEPMHKPIFEIIIGKIDNVTSQILFCIFGALILFLSTIECLFEGWGKGFLRGLLGSGMALCCSPAQLAFRDFKKCF